MLLRSPGQRSFSTTCLWVIAALGIGHWLCSRHMFATWWRRIPDWAFAAFLGLGTALALFFVRVDYRQFIYFQF